MYAGAGLIAVLTAIVFVVARKSLDVRGGKRFVVTTRNDRS
jgi:hypothetical protein